MRKVFPVLLVLLLLTISVAGMGAQDKTIAELVSESAAGTPPEFTTLLTAIRAADPAVMELLSDPEAKLTVFAPTDAAFDRLRRDIGDEAFEALLADSAALTNILLYHVVPEAISGPDIPAYDPFYGNFNPYYYGPWLVTSALLPTLQGQRLEVLIDTWYGAAVDNAFVLQLDIQAANGVIHVIDEVLQPEQRTLGEALVARATEGRGRLFRRGEFTELLRAIEAAPPQLLEALYNPDANVTVFAPTDAAFDSAREALGDEAYEALFADPAAIASILVNHMVPGRLYSQGVTYSLANVIINNEPLEVETLLPGSSFTVDISDQGGYVLNDNAPVVTRDLDFANGVVHVIDGVLVPAENTMYTSETITTEFMITIINPPASE